MDTGLYLNSADLFTGLGSSTRSLDCPRLSFVSDQPNCLQQPFPVALSRILGALDCPGLLVLDQPSYRRLYRVSDEYSLWLGADLCGQGFLLWLGFRARSSGSSHCELLGLLVVGQPTRLQLLLSRVTIHYGLEQLWPGIPQVVVRSAFFHYASSCSFNVVAKFSNAS